MTAFGEPVVAWRGATDPDAPLVVLLHGRGSNEADIIALADHLPDGPAYAAVRAPIGEGGGSSESSVGMKPGDVRGSAHPMDRPCEVGSAIQCQASLAVGH
jgi:hypothetical protein